MTSDHHAEACRGRIYVHFGDIMQHVNADALELEREPLGEFDAPRILVIVAADDINRGNGGERIDHACAADIASMNDALHPSQRLERFRSHQAVRIGYEPDFHRSPGI